MEFISKLLKVIRTIIIIALIVIIFFLPFEKAEVENTVVLLNPITLRYIAMTVSNNDGVPTRKTITHGVAESYTNEEGKLSYVFGFSLATYSISGDDFNSDNSKGRYDYGTIIKLVLKGTGE